VYSRPYQAELVAKYIEAIKKTLKGWGVNFSGVRYGNIPYYFHDLILRIPTAKPRQVFLSDVIKSDPKKLQSIDFIKRKAEKGDDIWPHLSRGWGKLKNLDKLYNNWGVYHLHLGEDIEKHGYVSRTQKVLLLCISSDAMHFIDVRSHGEEFPNLWYDIGIMNIILENWPDQLAGYRSLMTGHNISASSIEEVRRYRDDNFNMPLILSDGNAYISPGMISLEGLSSKGAMYYGDLLRSFGVVEQIWHEAPHELINTYFPWRIPPTALNLYVDRVWPLVRIKAEDSDISMSASDVWNLARKVLR
jgi:hypothetical protein